MLVAATRLLAVATSPWDWDEVQFMAAVREYEVGMHQPHPAGFPLYILLANAVQLFGLSDFRSLQVIAFAASCAVFPLLFLVAQELRFSFRTCILAALLFAFFPNIWYFGGTVFSDITGTAINLGAISVLLRGIRSPRAFLIGCGLVGAALSVRPHSGFILLAPLLLATWHQRHDWKRIIAGAFITASITFAAYLGAAMASESITVYIDRLTFFQKWVAENDSYRNPVRTPLPELAYDFFIRPMGAGRLSMIVTALSAIAVLFAAIRREAGPWVTLVTFGPYMVFAWLMHDPTGYHRYSTAYVALHALLAAYALEILATPARRAAAAVHIVIVAVIIGRYVGWVWPALQQVRTTVAPTHAASTWVQRAVPKGRRVWVDDSMRPWANYYLSDRRFHEVDSPGAIGLEARGDEVFLTEGMSREAGSVVFMRPRQRLVEIHPPRHFEASIVPMRSLWRFGEGWFDPEAHGDRFWRWMSGRSVTIVPAPPGPGRLTLMFEAPLMASTMVELRVNGVLVERFSIAAPAKKQWLAHGRPDGEATVIEITTDSTVNLQKRGLGPDDRELGLRLLDYRWDPLR